MRECYELSFDAVSFYEYSGEEKDKVLKAHLNSNDLNSNFNKIYFERTNNHCVFKEPSTGKVFVIKKIAFDSKSLVDLGYIRLENAIFKPCSKQRELDTLCFFKDNNKLEEYALLMKKLIVDSKECYDAVNNNEELLDQKSVKEVNKLIRKENNALEEEKCARINIKKLIMMFKR